MILVVVNVTFAYVYVSICVSVYVCCTFLLNVYVCEDPLQGDFPEVIEEFLEYGVMKCIAFNRRGTLLAGIIILFRHYRIFASLIFLFIIIQLICMF